MAEQIIADIDASGIYQIRNRKNGKRYVGSAICFRKRWLEHRRDLSRKEHHSVALQRSWEKYGEDNFEFLILEVCPKEQLIVREQFYIDQDGQYNICRVAGSSLGIRHSQKAKARMREAQQKRISSPGYVGPNKGRKYSREICERMASPKRGRKRPPRSAEWCRKISEAKKGTTPKRTCGVSIETREKIRATLLGRKRPIELRASDPRLTLTDDQVREIRKLRNEGLSYDQIADTVGYVSRNLARLVCIKSRYEWVDPDIHITTNRKKGWKVIGRKRGIRRNKWT